MLAAIAIVPSAPVLVPELAGAAAAELAEARAAVIAAAASLPPRWIVIGAGRADGAWRPETAGTFAGFGADLRVRLSPPAGEQAEQLAELPLCALFAAWARGQARPEASAEVRVYAGTHGADAALARGRQLRTEIDQSAEPTGVLVVADGVTTLTPTAPGGYEPRDAGVQRALDDALACGDIAALSRLPEQVVGRVAFQVLAGLAEPAPRSTKELYRGAPYGVGYFAGVWQP
ncbi:hypothetical protein MSM1_17125 [Mycobacterium sp. SM1]|uniref:hypothetical protein n=1 Tax=Mycobacterium sp. SM1 TaxID=2816243 RepID=UPI001BD02377|nr:hypothetical protein [Mycobacterium sp. SM1]MBS4729990.1 hypothetical protein [Mycobacterium sp. SM1]